MINFTIITILILPLVFQLIVGSKANKGQRTLSFWQVSLISLCGQVFSAVCNLLLISELITRNGSRNGLPWIGMLILELMVGGVLLVTILIQGYIQYRRHKISSE